MSAVVNDTPSKNVTPNKTPFQDVSPLDTPSQDVTPGQGKSFQEVPQNDTIALDGTAFKRRMHVS